MNILKKLSPILIVLVMLFSMIAATTPSAAAAENIPGCKQWHTVQSGDYLTKIAKQYNTTWQTLVDVNDLADPNLVFVGQVLCVSLTTSTNVPSNNPPTAAGVRVYASSVKEDQTVTLQGKSLVANTAYAVYLKNAKGNLATDIWVGVVTPNADGTFNATYKLPKKLYDVSKINITIVNGSGDTASNWFYNFSNDGYTGGIGSPVLSFTIVKVEEDESVKIQTSNLPANVTFQVYMGKLDTKGEEGILVGTLSSNKGGTVTATFEIPEELSDRSKIDILIESNTLEMSAVQTFENED